MLFAEALQQLKDRKMVARKSWAASEGYLVLLSGMKHCWKIITTPGPNAGNHIFSVDELSADDWEVVEGSNVDVEPSQLSNAA